MAGKSWNIAVMAAFGMAMGWLGLAQATSSEQSPRVLAVVAHPDDEYMFAGTIYRIAQEMGGTVDQLVVTNGEGGFRYSLLAEKIYGLELTREEVGRKHLPRIRKAELLEAGRILGVREHEFLDELDLRYTQDVNEALGMWNVDSVRAALNKRLDRENYDFVFVVLPTATTHGHHQAASILAIEAVESMTAGRRPVVLGATVRSSTDPEDDGGKGFLEREGFPITRVSPANPIFSFDRTRTFGFRDRLSYQIIVNWMIAAHKSQGTFQTYFNRHAYEDFRVFDMNGPDGRKRASALFDAISLE